MNNFRFEKKLEENKKRKAWKTPGNFRQMKIERIKYKKRKKTNPHCKQCGIENDTCKELQIQWKEQERSNPSDKQTKSQKKSLTEYQKPN